MKKDAWALMCMILILASVNTFAQSKVKATGTGNTTGIIANLSVHNTSDGPIAIQPQVVYIPSSGGYQPYVGFIPGTSIPVGEQVVITVTGYCADATAPPVPSGNDMPPLTDWIAVPSLKPAPSPGIAVITLAENIVPSFHPDQIPTIIESPGFVPHPPATGRPFVPTWPGIEQEIPGSFNADTDPKVIGPILIEAVDQIEDAFEKMRNSGSISTPFSADPTKEREAVIQQTFWVYASAVRKTEYTRETFEEKVIEQFEAQSGVSVSALPEPDRKSLDSGVSQFWNTFTAVGVEAKVIKI